MTTGGGDGIHQAMAPACGGPRTIGGWWPTGGSGHERWGACESAQLFPTTRKGVPVPRSLLTWLTTVAAALGLLVVAALSPQAAHAAPAPATQLRTYATQIAEMVDLHNAERVKSGLPTLAFSPYLSERYSQPWVNHLTDSGEFRHQSLEAIRHPGTQWLGENLIKGWYESPAELLARWMRSSGHRDNILQGKYKYLGVGWAVDAEGWTIVGVNFWGGSPSGIGATYASGGDWLADQVPPSSSGINVYVTPGTHNINGRLWRTACEAYSLPPRPIDRCRTEIWATIITYSNGSYSQANGWAFNNLTYKPAPRAYWAGNNLARNADWADASGRRWQTRCGTDWTGPSGCRTDIETTLVTSYIDSSGRRQYRVVPNQWVFNNVVYFSD